MWTKEKYMELINLYRDRPVLWDHRLNDYNDKNKKNKALLEIVASLGMEKEDVEFAIKNLVRLFLQEWKKERDSMESGAGNDDVYKSKWSCYSSMLFLIDRNRPSGMADTQTQDQDVKVTKQETQEVDHDQETLEDSDSVKEKSKKRVLESPLASSDWQKKHKYSATEETPSTLKNIQVLNASKDQYTVFGELVGMQIRDLPSSNAKKIVKHVISAILFEAEMGKYDNTNSVTHTFHHTQQFSNSPFSSTTVPVHVPSNPQQPSCSSRKSKTTFRYLTSSDNDSVNSS